MTSYLNSTVAKDGGEDWRREHGDDGQQDCNAGCDGKYQLTHFVDIMTCVGKHQNTVVSQFNIASKLGRLHVKNC